MAEDARANLLRDKPSWVTRDLITIGGSLLFTAMGANAFSQYVMPYLTEVRHWPPSLATEVLVIGFGFMPLVRFNYALIHRRIGDHGALLVGHLFFLFFLLTLYAGQRPLAPIAAGLCLAIAASLVFTSGTLQILDVTPVNYKGKASGAFMSSNYLAWLLASLLYAPIIRSLGLRASLFVAMALTLLGLIGIGLVPKRRVTREVVPIARSLALLRKPSLRAMALLMALSAFSFGLMFGAFARYASQLYGTAVLSLLVSGFHLARLPGSYISGAAADRWGLRGILVSAFVVAGLGLVAVSAFRTLPMIGVSIALLGLQQSTVPVLSMTLVGNSTATELRHATHAPLFAASGIGVAISLLLSHFAAELFTNMSYVFLVFGGVYFIAAASAYFLITPQSRLN